MRYAADDQARDADANHGITLVQATRLRSSSSNALTVCRPMCVMASSVQGTRKASQMLGTHAFIITETFSTFSLLWRFLSFTASLG